MATPCFVDLCALSVMDVASVNFLILFYFFNIISKSDESKLFFFTEKFISKVGYMFQPYWHYLHSPLGETTDLCRLTLGQLLPLWRHTCSLFALFVSLTSPPELFVNCRLLRLSETQESHDLDDGLPRGFGERRTGAVQPCV